MKFTNRKSQITLAAIAALGSTVLTMGAGSATAQTKSIAAPAATTRGKVPGTYVSGDFHNHTTCSDGSISMQKLVKKATDKADTPWGLDWFVQAGHGVQRQPQLHAGGRRHAEHAGLPVRERPGPEHDVDRQHRRGQHQGPGRRRRRQRQHVALAVDPGSTSNQVVEYLSALKHLPLFIGVESVVAGHEHASMSVITGQMPLSLGQPHAAHHAGVHRTRQRHRAGEVGILLRPQRHRQQPRQHHRHQHRQQLGLLGARQREHQRPELERHGAEADPRGGTGNGTKGHLKTVEAMKWMAQFHPMGSYYVPAHLERAGPFYADGNQGFNIEHLRNFNNAAPTIAFGMESQPGHGASANRGEYQVARNNINGVLVDSVGGTTWGGTGVYASLIGGVWDAMLGEAATSGSSRVPTGTTAACSAPTTAARRRTSSPANTSATT